VHERTDQPVQVRQQKDPQEHMDERITAERQRRHGQRVGHSGDKVKRQRERIPIQEPV
jgi:hypothetical protein